MSTAARLALFGGACALVGGIVYGRVGLREHSAPRQVASAVAHLPTSTSAAPAPGTIRDPLVPQRPVYRDTAPEQDVGDWVKARPRFQISRSAAERGGLEPCATQQVDTSAYTPWAALGAGRYVMPKDAPTDAAGRFDLILHLHGEEPVLRELVKSEQRFVLYTLTLPPDQGYGPLFSGSHLYESVVAEVEQAVSRRAGLRARVRRVVLSAWSAGFVGIESALAQPTSKDVDAVVLVDGLHAPRTDIEAFKAQLQPFVDYASRAAASERFMFVSHSSIDPPDFASTTECAHYLVASLGGKPIAVRRNDSLGLELVEYFTRGNFHVRGYSGNDKADHCAQLGVLRDVYGALGRRWAAPRPAAGTSGTPIAP
ncbi:MAG: hypothetical protein EOO73_24505 [Myxococcales bacterium]|nr:MAG: hypothetical protein EOO73_24505 [Myxococcales bacterium]